MNQKLSEWASIAEIISALAIVASLIFVGLEISQNTRATQNAAAGEMGLALLEVNKLIAQDDIATLFVKTRIEGLASLSEIEKEKLSAAYHVYFRVLQALYYQYRRDALDELLWEPLDENIGRMMMTGMAVWWDQDKFLYNREFVQYVDSKTRAEPGDE